MTALLPVALSIVIMPNARSESLRPAAPRGEPNDGSRAPVAGGYTFRMRCASGPLPDGDAIQSDTYPEAKGSPANTANGHEASASQNPPS